MRRSPPFARRLQLSSLSTAGALALGLLAPGCGQKVDVCVAPGSSTVFLDKLIVSDSLRVDLLFAIDNSRSMADKQQVLALAVPDLIGGLVNPPCVDPDTGVESAAAGPLEKCPAGTQRRFTPVLDMHVGILSTSLGGHGSDACQTSGVGKQSNNDKAHLLSRIDPTMAVEVETYQGLDFLAWDPAQQLAPPGEADVAADSAADPDTTALTPSLADMVLGVGQIGCGYEAQLESWYRFLVDPSPAEEVTLDAEGKVVLQGVDTLLLDQRKAFLRPDSLLAIIMLSDENDCSIRESGQFYYAAQQKSANGAPFHLPAARAICDQSPNDECCFSCGQIGPTDPSGYPICPDDPTCKTADGKTAILDEVEDNINLRCWNQKRRFGIDFLYGIDRYVNGLRSNTVTDRNGQVVPNPIFSDLDPSDANLHVRSSALVYLAGIVGVPWQDIARTNESGAPDLEAGLDLEYQPRGGFKSPSEMIQELPGKDYNTWDLILGDPGGYPAAEALPKDPLMLESVDPRSGSNPVTGDPLVTSAQPLANTINGHEYDIPKRDDLQYACIFPLPTPVDCAVAGVVSCDCEGPNDSPLCEVDPATGEPTMQVYAKAYPGIRELHLLKELDWQGIVASVCPAQVNDPSAGDFGYRKAISAILDRLVSVASSQCYQGELTPDQEGQVACLLLEARTVSSSAAAECNECKLPGRAPITAEKQGGVNAILDEEPQLGFNCFCEIVQLSGSAPGEPLWTCQNDPAEAFTLPVDGYCYIDVAAGVGNPEIVQKCPDTEQRLLRLVGAGTPQPGSTVYSACEKSIPSGPECAPAD